MSAQHTPGPLTVSLRQSDRHGDQYAIENDSVPRDGDWRDVYVHFSGYFGSYGPHVFAAAPDLLEVAEMVLGMATVDMPQALIDAAGLAAVKARGVAQ